MTLSYHVFHFRALSDSSFRFFWRYAPVIAKRFPSTALRVVADPLPDGKVHEMIVRLCTEYAQSSTAPETLLQIRHSTLSIIILSVCAQYTAYSELAATIVPPL